MYTAMKVEMELASCGSNWDSGAVDLLEVLDAEAQGKNAIRAPSDCVKTFGSLCGVLIQKSSLGNKDLVSQIKWFTCGVYCQVFHFTKLIY